MTMRPRCALPPALSLSILVACASAPASLPATTSVPQTAPVASGDTGRTWEVPPEDKARPNPVPVSPAALKKGGALFQKYCVACHGPKGKGDGPAAGFGPELPKDLTDADRQKRLTDGEIFWKLSNGHRSGGDVLMPSFSKAIPSALDRWTVVLFVRTLGSAGRQ